MNPKMTLEKASGIFKCHEHNTKTKWIPVTYSPIKYFKEHTINRNITQEKYEHENHNTKL